MIKKLRKRFIGISAASVVAVLLMVFLLASYASIHQLNNSIDRLADTLALNDGSFPEDFEFPSRESPPDNGKDSKDTGRSFIPQSWFITPESRFTTRFFVVRYDEDGNITENDVEHISSVTDEDAIAYAGKVLESRNEQGWISDFRYKKYDTDEGQAVLFIDGTANKNMTLMFVLSLGIVLSVTALVIILLLVLFSKKAIKPTAESYEKQKIFITDASHELKTPLTVIMTDLEIIESENGKSEWTEDIRAEGENMTELVNSLVNLSRMDENNVEMMHISDFSLSGLCNESVDKFGSVAGEKGLAMKVSIDEGCTYKGDERLIRQLVSVFMDNALKYCDEEGEIIFTLKNERHPVMEIRNTYADVDSLELDRLKERFYRADKARTSGYGYGIGLSLADSIIALHKGKMKIYKSSDKQIGFKITL